MRKTQTFFLLLMFCPFAMFGQRHTISGYATDNSTGEKLINANVYNAKTLQGTVSNIYGFFSITLPTDTVWLTVSYVGYKPIVHKFFMDKDTSMNISLSSRGLLEEVTISALKIESVVEKSQMSSNVVQMEMVRNLPVILGEVDLLKIIQLLPGVQSGTEGTSGFYVRGGGPDQNLILLDGVPVYNVNHLFGFFSVFNAEAINSATLIKGGFPARYGGRLSSVLDVRMKEGNSKEFKGDGSIGLISSRATLEGPIVKDKSSFIVSARRTYLDILAQPLIWFSNKTNSSFGSDERVTAGYYFYDLNAKINYKFSDRSRLFLSAYTGDDQAYMTNKYSYDGSYNGVNYPTISSTSRFKLKWGNITTSLRWNYMFNNKLFSNTTITYSRYRFLTGLGFEERENNKLTSESKFEYVSGIYDAGSKIDFDYLPSPNHYIRFGLNFTNHVFNPGITLFQNKVEGSTNIDTTLGNKKVFANEINLYAEDDFKIGTRLKLNAGLHFSNMFLENTDYHSLEPRISARFLISPKFSAKAAFSTMNQYLHLLSNNSIGLPTDLWLPVTDSIKPQNSWQYAAGFAYSLTDQVDISIEGFYKEMVNLIEYKEGASFLSLNDDWQQKVEIGKGNSYGIEFLVEKSAGKLTGWIGYTLSYAYRTFPNINDGKQFPYKYDRRHDISLVATYKFSERVDAGLTWVYGTGNAVTLVTDKFEKATSSQIYGYGWNLVGSYENRNGFRMPSYHRLDLGVNLHKQKKHGMRTWSWGVYNAYNRMNPFMLYIEDRGDKPSKLMQLSLFPIIPSFSYRFEF
jgi:outer membrane receptor for ferrienterochelin and colicin